MIYGYARVSTDGQSVNAQAAALRKHGAGKVYRDMASGAKTERVQLRRVIGQVDAGDACADTATARNRLMLTVLKSARQQGTERGEGSRIVTSGIN